MFRPDKINIDELDFEDQTEILGLAHQIYFYYAEKEPNIFMVDQLTAGIYDDRMKPAEALKLLLESYLVWMLIQDQGSKWNFAYLRKIFENKRQDFINHNLEIAK